MLALLAFERISAEYKVFLTPNSIKENPTVFKKFIAHREYFHANDPSVFDGLVITGDGGDALFLDAIVKGPQMRHGDAVLDWDWKDGFVKGMWGTPEENKFVLGLLEPAMHDCPWPVKTVRDFFAWTGLAIFYQPEVLRWLPTLQDPKKNWPWVRPFFATKEFVEWSLGQEPKIKYPSTSDYKPTFRKLCEKFSGLDLSDMRKDFSLGKTRGAAPMVVGVMEDLTHVTTEGIEKLVKE
jgi:hypothetical protein